MLAVYKREFRSYFQSMIGYVFLSCVLAFIGIYFLSFNLLGGYPFYSYVMASGASTIFMFMVPILTMKSFAEERKAKTDQMLLTAPVSVTQIVLGKYFSMMSIVAIALLICSLCPLVIATTGNSYLATDYATIFAFFCMAGLYVSIGMFISSCTENQIISAVLSFIVLIVLYLWDTIVGYIPETEFASMVGFLIHTLSLSAMIYAISKNGLLTLIIGGGGIVVDVIWYLVQPSSFGGLINKVLSIFSCNEIVNNFAYYSVFDFGGLFYYISVSALFVFLTCQMIQKRRWS